MWFNVELEFDLEFKLGVSLEWCLGWGEGWGFGGFIIFKLGGTSKMIKRMVVCFYHLIN